MLYSCAGYLRRGGEGCEWGAVACDRPSRGGTGGLTGGPQLAAGGSAGAGAGAGARPSYCKVLQYSCTRLCRGLQVTYSEPVLLISGSSAV